MSLIVSIKHLETIDSIISEYEFAEISDLEEAPKIIF